MSFQVDLARFIADQTSLTMDTDCFVGGFLRSCPDECVVVTFIGGGEVNESGLVSHNVHILARSTSYLQARTLSYTVFNLLDQIWGFKLSAIRTFTGSRTWAGLRTWQSGTTGSNIKIFSSEVTNMPYLFDRDGSLYIFAFDFTIRRMEDD